MSSINITEAAAQRFWNRVDKSGDCWLWMGSKTSKNGYGRLQMGGREFTAHRVSYQLQKGDIPDGLVIDHICHTPPCVNPAHLRAVTNKQNTENFGHHLSTNTSGVRGVSWVKPLRRWVVRVVHNGHTYSGKTHATLDEAKAAVSQLRLSLHTHNDLDRIMHS